MTRGENDRIKVSCDRMKSDLGPYSRGGVPPLWGPAGHRMTARRITRARRARCRSRDAAGCRAAVAVAAIMEAFTSLARAVDERVSLKHVHKRLGALAKVLIVTTFMEDALRVLLTFSVQQQSMRIAGWQTPALHSALPVLSFCVQFGGSLLIVLPADAGHRAVAGCYILLGWCLFHPFMYKQQTNWEFMLETTTIMGGLLVLLSHEQLNVHASDLSLPGTAKPTEALKERANRLQMVGRFLITAIFLYCAPPATNRRR